MKLFKTNNTDAVSYCRMQFNFVFQCVLAQKRRTYVVHWTYRLDHRLRLWAPTSASRAVSAVAELLVTLLIKFYLGLVCMVDLTIVF